MLYGFPIVLGLVISGGGFQAKFAIEPAFLSKELPMLSLFFPYGPDGSYYFNNRISAKLGKEFQNGLVVRGVGGFAQSFVRNGLSCCDPYGYTNWFTLEGSLGLELGYQVRFRKGKGELFCGLEGVFAWLDGNHIDELYTEDWSFYYETYNLQTFGIGPQAYIGLSYPVANLGKGSLRLTTGLRGGAIFLEPTYLESGIAWKGYPSVNGAMPRWGISVGFEFVPGQGAVDLADLPDLRCQYEFKKDTLSTCCCVGGCCLSGCDWGGREMIDMVHRWPPIVAQSVVTFVIGPALGNAVGICGAAMLWDATFDDFHRFPFGFGFYIWPAVGSVIGAYGSGVLFNPGGCLGYTIAGALTGNLANLVLTQSYISITGRNTWVVRWPPFSVSYNPDVIAVMAVGSLLPVAGAVVGYNLSLKHARESTPDTMGLRPTWTERVAADFNPHFANTSGIEIASVTFDF
ncbi:hypothetical protein JXM67_00720 [candidate division WOR-3 bacterium]|nr:hypothetical protein [candidate division WOR-3 bacterium]